MSAMRQIFRPTGIVVDVSVPRWLVRLIRAVVAVWIIAFLVLIVVSLVFFASDPNVSVWSGPSLAVTSANFDARPVEYQVRLTAGSEEATDLDKEWTLLMSTGSIHWANLVEGPKKLKPGETGTFTLIFLFDPQPQEGEPVSLRWDPGRKTNAWIDLSRQ